MLHLLSRLPRRIGHRHRRVLHEKILRQRSRHNTRMFIEPSVGFWSLLPAMRCILPRRSIPLLVEERRILGYLEQPVPRVWQTLMMLMSRFEYIILKCVLATSSFLYSFFFLLTYRFSTTSYIIDLLNYLLLIFYINKQSYFYYI